MAIFPSHLWQNAWNRAKGEFSNSCARRELPWSIWCHYHHLAEAGAALNTMVWEVKLLRLPWFSNESSCMTAQHLLVCLLNAQQCGVQTVQSVLSEVCKLYPLGTCPHGSDFPMLYNHKGAVEKIKYNNSCFVFSGKPQSLWICPTSRFCHQVSSWSSTSLLLMSWESSWDPLRMK